MLPMAQFDVVVVGLGVTGAAALHRLAHRGVRALGIERLTPGHDQGSSHGESRIIRLGYFEHPSYVPLLRRSYELWRELEAEANAKLLHITGIVEIGPPDGEVVSGTLAASRLHGLPHEVMNAAETMRRFPAFKIPDDDVGVFQPDGGFIAAEPAIAAMLAQARVAGAEIQTNTAVHSVTPHGNGVRIETSTGEIDAGTAVVAAGPWLHKLMPDLPAPLRVTREVMGWFEPRNPVPFLVPFLAGPFPVFLLESPLGQHYGFPPWRGGLLKIAKHHHRNETVDPDQVDRVVSAEDEALIRPFVSQYLPAAAGPLRSAKTCLYTMTPDRDFLIDRLPGAPNIIVASPCSGHGFKFAPVVGEILADLATGGETGHDINRFRFGRFG
jgi:sarcosine oxidase